MAGYIVPQEMPKYCNDCPFGYLKFQCPWDDPIHNGDMNLKWGFTCNLLHKETARGNYRTDLPKPEECPLKEMVGENNDL